MIRSHAFRLRLLTVALVYCGTGYAQEGPTFTSEVNVTQVLATVKDSQGRLVKDLTRSDFVLKEEGVVQEIRHFARHSDLPLTLGLLVDTSLSQRRVLEEQRRASYTFFEQVLRPEEDRAFVMSFDVEAALLEDITRSPDLLRAALQRLRVPQEQGREGIGTVLYDSVYLAGDDVLIERSGRKALIVISDGVDFGSRVDLRDAIESAQRADALVYSIRYYDERDYRGGGRRPGMGRGGRGGGSRSGGSVGWPGGGGSGRSGGPGGGRRGGRREMPDGQAILQELSSQTGGTLFKVTKKQSLESIFQQIQDELRSQYSIAYSPSDVGSGDGFRRITLTTARPDLKVVARRGYYRRDP